MYSNLSMIKCGNHFKTLTL